MEPQEEQPRKLTDKQTRFVEEYCIDFNATQAAIRAGYSEDSARYLGHETLTKPYVREAVNERLRALSMSAEETAKAISDIAKNSLNEFFVTKLVEHIPRVEKHLSVVIKELEEEIDFEEEYASAAGLEGGELELHRHEQARRTKALVRYQMKLDRDPNATIITNGPVEWIETTELDMVKIVKAKEAGRIKSFHMTKDGPKIELYAADAALTNLARIHGLFVDKTELTGKDGENLALNVNINIKKSGA